MLIQHTAIYLVGCGLPGLVNFLAIALYTHLLLPDDYGLYAIVISTAGLFNAIFFEWLRLSLLRFFEAAGKRPEGLLSTLLLGFMACAAMIALIGALIVALVLEPSWWGLAAIGFALLCVQAWFDLNLELARIQFSPVRYSLMVSCRAVIGLACGTVLILLGFGALGALLGLLIGVAIAALPTTFVGWKGTSRRQVDRRQLKGLLAYGLPLTVGLSLNFIVSTSDRFFIAWLLGQDATGIYAAGYDLVWHTLTMLMMVIHLAGYPLAVRALETKGVEACREQVRQNLLLLAAIGFPAAAGIAMCAPAIAGVVLGEAFRDAAIGLIPWVAAGALLARFKTYYIDLSFHLGRNTLGQVWVMGAAAALNVLLNLLLIPLYGVQGAIYGTVAAYAVACVLGAFVGRRLFPLPAPPPEILKTVAATIIMIIALWPMRHGVGITSLLTQMSIGSSLYGITLFALDFAGCRSGLWRLLARRRTPVV